MESSFRTSDVRKRRKSSIENEIMEQRLQAWREKKGLSTRKENKKLSLKHTTPSQQSKRKSIQMSKSEKKMDGIDAQRKQARFYTLGHSTLSDVATNRRRTCSTLQTKKEPGRRSLAPATRMNTPQLTSNSMKRAGNKETTAIPKLTVNPNKECKIQSSSKPQQAPVKSPDESHALFKGRKSHGQSHDVVQGRKSHDQSHDVVQCRKSVRFFSIKQAMKARLEQWLVSKGKTPSRFHNFMGYESSLHPTPVGSLNRRRSGTPHVGRNRRDTPGKSVSDEGAVHSTMKECLEMVEEGCSLEDMSAWLDGMVTKVPLIQQCAGYWLCRAKIAEKQGGDQSAIECLFEAVQFNPKPVKDILDTLATYRLKLKMSHEESETRPIETGMRSPLRHSPCLDIQTPIAHLSFGEEVGNQSANERHLGGDMSHLRIKFSLKETTPYMARIHEALGHSPTTSCLLVTPVRRSARLDNKRRSVACLGSQVTCNLAIAECLDSLGDVAATYPKAQLILRPNRALNQEFSEADLGE